MIRQFKRIVIGGLTLVLAATPSLVSACGGFFGPPNLAVDLNAFRVAFSVSKDHQVTEIVDVKFTGTAADFSWIMPLPGTPTVDVTEPKALAILQANTDSYVSYPIDYCNELNYTSLGLGGGAGGDGGTLGSVGPYDYAIIKNDSPGQLIKWLRDNGYTIKPVDEPMIAQYVKEGNTFVAMKLQPGADVQDIQPVVFRYQSAKITIPVRMGAIASTSTVPIQAWIFSDSQYAPTNYARVDRPILGAVRAANEVLRMGLDDDSGVVDPADEYPKGVKAIQDKYQGHAFITELAMKTADFIKLPVPPFYPAPPPISEAGAVIGEMLSKFPYLTRLTAQLAPKQMTLDPLFAPVSGLPDVLPTIDLGQAVDPLTLYGCTTRAAIEPRIVTEFSTSHTTFSALHFDVGHPSDWQLSQFTVIPTFTDDFEPVRASDVAPQTIYAFSPQPVTAQTIDRYFKGGATPPMFVFTKLTYSSKSAFRDGYESAQPPNTNSNPHDLMIWTLLQALGRDLSKDHDLGVSQSFRPYREGEGDTLIAYAILASKAQWQTNNALFEDMLRYAGSHQFYSDASTRDTLFLSVLPPPNPAKDIYELPIPNDWITHLDSQHDILIDSGKGDSGPAMRLTLTGSAIAGHLGDPYNSHVSAAQVESDYQYPAETVQRALSFYGLPGTPNDAAISNATQQCPSKDKALQAAPFHSGGRTGLVLLTNEYIVGVYAPDAEFASDQPTLQKMMDAYISGYRCGLVNANSVSVNSPTPLAGTSAAPNDVRAACPKATVPRLTVGGKGKVTPGTPDNLRQRPTSNAVVLAQMPPGSEFMVVRGPICDPTSELLWWQVTYHDTYNSKTGWVAEGQGAIYYVQPA